MSVPKAVTPSYTRAYHAALNRDSLQSLTCPSLPRSVPCNMSPAILLRLMPASGFCVPVPVTSGRTAPPPAAGNLKILKKFNFFQNNFTYALSCPLSAF
ncbi:unnamed protein product [Staurois parvus]|uniref:Uncharacterized protein n=1 Tax=Staurois parvus TaxID=386267 RepID=A0ABN9AYW4_9NEOB|nr:unnamed protein product [Staurois parvus]